MRSRIRLAPVVLAAAIVGSLPHLPTTVAHAADEPDTTPPRVHLNPCWTEASCRRVYAEVYGDLEDGDDLAVLGARIGEEVIAEHVFDDGSGFQPYGSFISYGNDVAIQVDYALRVPVPRGSSDITFYARDLEGNTSELTTTVLGPVPPGPVERLEARRTGARRALVSWRVPQLGGSCCARFTVITPGYGPRHVSFAPPGRGRLHVTYRKLSPGWHRFTVSGTAAGGTGPSRSVRLFVPRAGAR